MEQRTKYIDANKIMKNKEKISATVPRYIYDDIQAFSDLTGNSLTDIVTDALFEFFRYKIVTNDYLLGYGDLYFDLPLTKEFKENAIANKIKLNQNREIIDHCEQVTIKTITNNLDIFDGDSYTANKENINHMGIDFKIIPSAIEVTDTINFDKLMNLIDALYVFYYEVSDNHNINVFLINPVDAINKLSSVNHKLGNDLIECLQDMENYQKEINNNYRLEMQELHHDNKYVSNDKEIAILDKYTSIFNEVLKDVSSKYNNPNIILGFDADNYMFNKFKSKINDLRKEHEINQRIIKHQDQ